MSNVDIGRYKRIVQYFWDPEPKNDDSTKPSIWCLGKEYTSNARASANSIANEDQDKTNEYISSQVLIEDKDKKLSAYNREAAEPHPRENEDGGWPSEFLDDFESRFWLTYRSNFPSIKKSSDPAASSAMSLSVRLRSQLVDQGGFTSDTGWGCMIRSGQCLLANALGLLRLGRDWRRGSKENQERRLLSSFADDSMAPFSIHKFVSHGATACGKHPGEWFGPSATARCIEALAKNNVHNELRIYVTGDGADIYEDTFLKLAKADDGKFTPVLILVGIRLGIDRVTPAYWDALKASVQLSQSIGIAGGRPSSSHYFVGVQGDNFFYLDPHQARPMLPWYTDTDKYSLEEIDSCHTRRLRRLHIKDMDPSMLIGYLIRDEGDWYTWRQATSQTQGKAVVHVADSEPVLHGHGAERQAAVDEVQTFDDEEIISDGDEGDGELIEHPGT